MLKFKPRIILSLVIAGVTALSCANFMITSVSASTATRKVVMSKGLLATLEKSKSLQAVIVQVPYESSVTGTCETYSKISGVWKLISVSACVVGINGVSANKHEGDMTTPEGVYGFLYEFGSAANPGTKMIYKKTSKGDYWSSLRTSAQYNTWVRYPSGYLNTSLYENLYTQSLYKYAAATDFNYGKNKVIGKGSAIFFHIAPPSGGGTAGCVALKLPRLLPILKWLDPSSNPKICIGTPAYFASMK